jgi:Fur family ferric uptake transcriptional regulator
MNPVAQAKVLSMKSAEKRQTWALERCRSLPLRLTRVRERILALLARQRLPVTLAAVAQAAELRGQWNPATVYRSLMLFADAHVVRQLRLHSKFSYFALNMPGESFHYLVCTRCGALADLPPSKSVRSLVRELTSVHGFAAREHELALFGLCPSCQRAALRETPALKLMSRFKAMTPAKP